MPLGAAGSPHLSSSNCSPPGPKRIHPHSPASPAGPNHNPYLSPAHHLSFYAGMPPPIDPSLSTGRGSSSPNSHNGTTVAPAAPAAPAAPLSNLAGPAGPSGCTSWASSSQLIGLAALVGLPVASLVTVSCASWTLAPLTGLACPGGSNSVDGDQLTFL